MRDPKTEKWLEGEGWTFEYHESIPVAQIIMDKLAKQQIRLGVPIDDHAVVRYAEAMLRGAEFPAIVVAREDEKFALMDGIHRTSAFLKNHVENIDAYIVTNVTKDTYERLRRSINTIGGKGMDYESSLQQAMFLINQQGMSTPEAARTCNVNGNTLSAHVREQQDRKELSEIYPDYRLGSLPRDVIYLLGSIQRADLKKIALQIACD